MITFIVILTLFGTQQEFKLIRADSIVEPPAILSDGKVVLKPELKPPYHIYLGNHRIGYKATKITPKEPRYILQILVGVASLAPNSTKECSVFIWKDANGSPGEKLFARRLRVRSELDGLIYWFAYDFPQRYRIDSTFWAGSCEWDTLYPTLVFDRTRSLPSKIKSKDAWVDTSFDWFHGVYVNYDTAALYPEIYVSPDKLEFHIEK